MILCETQYDSQGSHRVYEAIEMEFGDRLFWGIMVFVGTILLWLGVLERIAPLWVGAIIAALASFTMVKYGPRPKAQETETGE